MEVKSFVSRLASSNQIPLHQITMKLANGDDFWCLIFSPAAKIRELKAEMLNNAKLSDYGKIVYSGFGKTPPEYIIEKVTKEYNLKLKEEA